MSEKMIEGEIHHHFEPPDTVLTRYIGDIDSKQVLAANWEAERIHEQITTPYHFLILDASKLTSFSTEARRTAADSGGRLGAAMRAIAIVGASFHYRALGTLVSKAAALLYRQRDNPVRFFNTEDEARVWIDERRRTVGSRSSIHP